VLPVAHLYLAHSQLLRAVVTGRAVNLRPLVLAAVAAQVRFKVTTHQQAASLKAAAQAAAETAEAAVQQLGSAAEVAAAAAYLEALAVKMARVIIHATADQQAAALAQLRAHLWVAIPFQRHIL
jgi:hypothetical protein